MPRGGSSACARPMPWCSSRAPARRSPRPGRRRLRPAAPTWCSSGAPPRRRHSGWRGWPSPTPGSSRSSPATSPRRLRPVADRLAGRSLGLVLAGGGARAFAHVGVLRELEDAGLHVDRVTGASIGAVIAALHASGVDGETLEEICYAEFVRRRPFSDYRLSGRSLARGHRVRAAMVRHYGPDTVLEGLPRQLSMVSVDLVSRTRQVHRRGNLVDAALASARLPGALRAPAAGGRSAARRRRGARQPAERPARRARRGPGRGGDHRVRRRRPAPARAATGARPRRHPDAHDDDRQRWGGRCRALAGRLGRRPGVDGRRTAGVPPARPDGAVGTSRGAGAAGAGLRRPRCDAPRRAGGVRGSRTSRTQPDGRPDPGPQPPKGQPCTIPGSRPGST